MVICFLIKNFHINVRSIKNSLNFAVRKIVKINCIKECTQL